MLVLAPAERRLASIRKKPTKDRQRCVVKPPARTLAGGQETERCKRCVIRTKRRKVCLSPNTVHLTDMDKKQFVIKSKVYSRAARVDRRRSEERRVGKECRSGGRADRRKK